MVVVRYRSGDADLLTSRVAGSDACADAGWYFDDPAALTQVLLCPSLCRTVQADAAARIEVALGCLPVLL